MMDGQAGHNQVEIALRQACGFVQPRQILRHITEIRQALKTLPGLSKHLHGNIDQSIFGVRTTCVYKCTHQTRTRTQIKYAAHIRHTCGQVGGGLVKQVETGYQGSALTIVLCGYGVELILYGLGIHIILSFKSNIRFLCFQTASYRQNTTTGKAKLHRL